MNGINMPEEKQRNQDTVQPTPEPKPSIGVSGGIGLLAQVSNLAWNLVIPIVGGVLLGHFLDTRRGDGITWTLSLLTLGVLMAFINLYELNVNQRHDLEENTIRDNSNPELNDEEK
jgi:F0F1-type ATP synthase assembly protein I